MQASSILQSLGSSIFGSLPIIVGNTCDNEASQQASRSSVQHPSLGSSIFGSLPWSSEILLWETNTSNNEASQQACSVQHPSLGSSIFGSFPWSSELLLWEIHATMKLHSKPRDPPCSILPRGLRSLARCHGPRNYYCGKYMQQ